MNPARSNREQQREARRAEVRQEIERLGLTLETSARGLHRIHGRGIDLRVTDLAQVDEPDLKHWCHVCT